MYTLTCDTRDKSGIIQIDQSGSYEVIANRTLYEQHKAQRFAVVNRDEQWVNSVHQSPNRASKMAEQMNEK